MNHRICSALLLAIAAPLAAEVDLDAVDAWREANGTDILRGFAELLAIPNTPAHPEGLRRTAEWARDELAARGAAAELLEWPGAPPLVWARLTAPGATRTLGVYVHYDGQPVDPPSWTHPPFEPVLYTASMEAGGRPRPFPERNETIDPNWYIYARSAGDDKAPIPAMLAALDALKAQGTAPTVNLVFLFEGEEERGSTHLGQFFEEYRDRLDVDLWLICDGPVHQSRRPQLVFGVRGYSGIDLTVYGAERYLHSGHYGNWAPNPAWMLAELLATMRDDDGNVLIESFYDSVEMLSPRDREAVLAVPGAEKSLQQELGLVRTEGGGASLIERIMVPSLNIRGMASATVGPTARNIVPRIAEASLDVRLVKGNNADEQLDLIEAHIRKQGYTIVREDPDHATRLAHPKLIKVVRRPGYPAVRTSIDAPVAAPIIEAADRAAGESVILMPTLGGSLPLYLFTEQLGDPIVVVPIANHDDNQHAPDENMRIGNLWYGIRLFAAIFATED
ncbi:MAG: M20/M25/M40 family metallo-hydrolase [Acidobacteria bacterium]|nr:M20/M25/M40 family metallo-hydrolase [Acidobacteriota bacterium]NIM61316.1 M20/M25/M40 family metallo-hydrolase [Acidobacteriota bacterium]NIT10500.1 M20/M25/M40 family metallo-hydrolase [Acidobacteriota bacterium]